MKSRDTAASVIGRKVTYASCVGCGKQAPYAQQTTLTWDWEDADPERACRSLYANLCKECREQLKYMVDNCITRWAEEKLAARPQLKTKPDVVSEG